MHSEGSALRENEKYLDSIQGKIDQFNNSMQTMWNNTLNSDVIKTFVDIGKFLVEAVDNIGVIETAIVGIFGYLTLIKKFDLSKIWGGAKGLFSSKNNKINLLSGSDLEKQLSAFKKAVADGPEALAKFKLEAKAAGNGMDIFADKVENGTIKTKAADVAAEDYTLALSEQSQAAYKAQRAETLKNATMAVSAILIAGIISAIQSYADSIQTIEERYEELQSNLSDVQSDVESLDSELETISDRIDELSSKTLTITEAEELKRLKQESAELEKQKELRENMLPIYKKQNDITSLEMFNKKISETAALQEDAKEGAKMWASILGTVADVALFAGGILVTGASFGGAGALGATMIGAGSSGAMSSLAGWAADSWGGQDKSVGTDINAWYDSYVDAIAEKEQAATEAEAKYLSDLSDANYDAWQKKVDESNKLKESLYNNLEDLQGYIDGMEYNDITAPTIDKFNGLLTHISIQSMDGDIQAQVESISALESEFNELSKGVDEHGNNIALTAEEYTRYNAIVAQVLAYQTGLTKGYDENGNAILKAADGQYTYNQLLEQSIALLKQQHIEEAKKLVGLSDDETANADFKASFDAAGKFNIINSSNLGYQAFIEGSLEKNIDDDFDFADSYHSYIVRNIDAVNEKFETIVQDYESILKSQTSFDENTINRYVSDYRSYLEKYIQQYQDGKGKKSTFVKNKLSMAPQASDGYYDLSGNSLSFINDYVTAYTNGIENIEDLSYEKLEEHIKHIEQFTNDLSDNEGMQKAISDLFTLDASSMPLTAYTEQFNTLFTEICNGLEIDEKTKQQMYAKLFPDVGNIDVMKNKVKDKLTANSKGLVDNLSLEELRVAFKLVPELGDDITFNELKEKIAEKLGNVDGPIVQTYADLSDQVAKYNDIAQQTSEIVLDNTKVTQEYKDSLIELGISETELAECFDKNNKLVVTNANKLNNLVKSTSKNAAQNIQLAKSQAKLQYYELAKKMSSLVDANGKVTKGNVNLVLSYYAEMGVIEKTISRYSMLETKLLGTVNAYETFQQAQEIDSETNYIGNMEEMLQHLGEAFNSAKLGSESAQAAIMGLVPESVYENLDTVDEKMAAIHKYFKEGKLSQYFDLTFDEDGNIESAEMKLGNLRKFIEDGLAGTDGTKVFEGTDWQHFEFSDEFLAQLDELPEGADKLQAFADAMGVTKDVAFAFIQAINDHDIDWLDGDYSSLFDTLLANTNSDEITLYTQRLAECAAEEAKIHKQYEDGKITADQYAKKLAELAEKYKEYQDLLNKSKEEAKENVLGGDGYAVKTPDDIANTDIDDLDNYIDAQEKVNQLQEEADEKAAALSDAQEKLAEAKKDGSEATEEEITQLEDAYKIAAKEALNASEELDKAIKKRDTFTKPDVLEIGVTLEDIDAEIKAAGDKFDYALMEYFNIDEDGYYTIKPGVDMAQLETDFPGVMHYINLLNSKTQIEAFLNGSSAEESAEKLKETIDLIIKQIEENLVTLDLDDEAVNNIVTQANKILGGIGNGLSITPKWGIWELPTITFDTSTSTDGQASVNGTAHASGSWGLPQDEHDSLVGELGSELVVDPSTGRYYTVGDNGAEFVDLKRGSIIFNHKQTEELLKNGHIASRGKAYAEGNAHVTIWPNGSSKTQWEGTGYSSWDDPTYDITEALTSAFDDASDSVNEFSETIDWIAFRMEELDAALNLYGANLENQSDYISKNNVIDNMIAVNKDIYASAKAGSEYYVNYAEKYLAGMSKDLADAARNGAISITEFTKEQDQATVDAINNYRTYASKAKDLAAQAESAITEIRNKLIEKIDNIQAYGSAKTNIEDLQTEKLQSRVDYQETNGFVPSIVYYGTNGGNADNSTGMFENSYKKIEYWTPILEDMRKKFDEAVQLGKENGGIDVESVEWYDQIAKIYEVDAAIFEAKAELEEFQNAINDIYWENFDNLINQFESLENEAQKLIDLMSHDDMIAEPQKQTYKNGTVEFWTEDDVKWTKEGITSLGLYAQKMEIAEKKAVEYGKEIDKLASNHDQLIKDGIYSESEYQEKLKELTDAQYENIEAYYDAQDAIVSLNQERIDSIKNGIEKEIEAFEELIKAKQNELTAEKD